MKKVEVGNAMLKIPPSYVLKKILKKEVTLTKYTYSDGEDAYGQRSRSVSGTYKIKAEIQEITSEDLAYVVPGTMSVGDAFGFFLPTYLVQGKNISIEAEDEITWNSKTWRIDSIEDYYYGEKIWYKRAVLKRVV